MLDDAAMLASGTDPTGEPLTAAHTRALGVHADIQGRLLDKKLPDLKAVELSGTDGGPVMVSRPERERVANRIVLAGEILKLL